MANELFHIQDVSASLWAFETLYKKECAYTKHMTKEEKLSYFSERIANPLVHDDDREVFSLLIEVSNG
jgi:hypothetical protein